MDILFLGKRGDSLCEAAAEFTAATCENTTIADAALGESLPQSVSSWQGDYILSYLCPWVLPANILERASRACLNFHPGPPEYPGAGCTNMALYHEVAEYGVTCHHMIPRVDAGPIVQVRRFPVFQADTVLTLTRRCHAHIAAMFYDIISMILRGEALPTSEERWTRTAYTRKDLDALKVVTPDMDEAEVARRIRATTYPGWDGARMELHGRRFYLEGSAPKPKDDKS